MRTAGGFAGGVHAPKALTARAALVASDKKAYARFSHADACTAGALEAHGVEARAAAAASATAYAEVQRINHLEQAGGFAGGVRAPKAFAARAALVALDKSAYARFAPADARTTAALATHGMRALAAAAASATAYAEVQRTTNAKRHTMGPASKYGARGTRCAGAMVES